MLFNAILLLDRREAAAPIRSALGELGGELAYADSIADVIARRRPADVIVIDVADPEAACARLVPRLRGTPLVAIVDADSLAPVLAAGADDCVRRDAARAELVARLRAAMRAGAERLRRARRERKLADHLRAIEREKHQLERIACVDSLTGIANRRHALALLDAEWKRSARDGRPLSVVMVDLDYFHAYNERYGHGGGDGCLRRTCAAMVGSLRRPSDVLGRYGGEEFIAVLAGTDAGGAAIVAERLRGAVEALAIPHAESRCARVVTISVGFATCRAQPDTVVADLLAKADHALLTAKANGRNRSVGEAPPAAPRAPISPLPWTRFPIVVADPWFADRIPPFLVACRGEARNAAAACAAGEFERVRQLARRLRAAANDHGIDRIARLAARLDHGARHADRVTITRVLDELAQYVDHVQVTYRRPLDQTA
ncbi:MAG TPA: diguanylate cyclase [Kofleriaceae bacterium]|nr:diguanylate cyclase [Kofleriaceae bacterium]